MGVNNYQTILRIELNDQICYSEQHLMVPEHFYCWVAGSFKKFIEVNFTIWWLTSNKLLGCAKQSLCNYKNALSTGNVRMYSSKVDNIRLHVALSYAFSANRPFSLIPSLTLANHRLLGLLVFLLPCNFISVTLLPMWCSSLLIIIMAASDGTCQRALVIIMLQDWVTPSVQ